MDREKVREAAQSFYGPMTAFAQKLIQKRSDTGHEREVADAIYEEME